jgi:hypothetical protein
MMSELDAAELPAGDATAFERMVDAALAETQTRRANPHLRDDLQYELEITRGKDKKVLRGSDASAGPATAALAQQMSQRARPVS